jgi:hemoglobin-like flavoprotein
MAAREERTMTDEQIRLVRVTWLEVAQIADAAARLFYERLFETDPEVRQLFAHSDMDQQRVKLLRTLTVAVGALDKLETIRPALENLGRRHVGYGVEDSSLRAGRSRAVVDVGTGAGRRLYRRGA